MPHLPRPGGSGCPWPPLAVTPWRGQLQPSPLCPWLGVGLGADQPPEVTLPRPQASCWEAMVRKAWTCLKEPPARRPGQDPGSPALKSLRLHVQGLGYRIRPGPLALLPLLVTLAVAR